MPSLFGKSGSTAGRAKPGRKSIRGTISAPIPIPTTPDDDEFPFRKPGSTKASVIADDEFPIRTPGAGIASPLPATDDPASSPEEQPGQSEERGHGDDVADEVKQEQEVVPVSAQTSSSASTGASGGSHTDLPGETPLEPPSTPPPAPPTEIRTSVGRPASRLQSRSPHSRTSPQRNSPLGVSPSRGSPPRGSPPARRATNPVLSSIRYSAVSESPSKQTTQSKDSPQRKKSTLRSALGRLFGRGRKKNANASDSGPLGSPQHRSDPTALSRPNQVSPKRSASVPINEFDRPLRSHSIGPDDLMAIESARNSLHLEAAAAGAGSSTGAGGRRRAATAGGRMLLRPHIRNQGWGGIGLSPRPASAQGRSSRLGGRAESEDPDEIGRAITSDSANGLRRRSRSLSGLKDLTGIRPSSRRRSDEIRYWRASYDPGFMSPLSSNAQEDIDDTGMVDVSAPSSPAVERPPKTPPQPFNFGLLSKEMVGMKITQAANMDIRLGDLESRTLQLERVVDKLNSLIPGFRGPVNAENTAWPSSSRRSLESESRSEVSIGAAPTYIGSIHPSSSSATHTQPLTATPAPPIPPRSSRPPSNNSTVRGASSMPILGRETGFGGSHITPQDDTIAQLRSDLDAERAARQTLEAQVKKLSERLNTLSSTMFAMVRGPSESRSQERLGLSFAASASSSLLPLSQTLVVPPIGGVEQPLSVFEADDDEDDDVAGEGQGGKEGVLGEGGFQILRGEETPGEETPVVCGAFGEELKPDDDDGLEEDDPRRKKAARTLSLSQLTLKKGQKAQV